MPGDSPGTRGVLGGTPAILLGAPGKLPRRPPTLRGTPGNSVRVPAKSADVPGDLPGAPANLPEARPGKPRFSRFFPKNYPNRLQTSADRRECRGASAHPGGASVPANRRRYWLCAARRARTLAPPNAWSGLPATGPATLLIYAGLGFSAGLGSFYENGSAALRGGYYLLGVIHVYGNYLPRVRSCRPAHEVAPQAASFAWSLHLWDCQRSYRHFDLVF